MIGKDPQEAFAAFVRCVEQATAGVRFSRLDERTFQGQLAQCLEDAGMKPVREFKLACAGDDVEAVLSIVGDRVDFYFFDGGFALECKMDRSVSAHLRQCKRYAEHDCVNGVLLCAMATVPRSLPEELGGKPFGYLNFALKCL